MQRSDQFCLTEKIGRASMVAVVREQREEEAIHKTASRKARLSVKLNTCKKSVWKPRSMSKIQYANVEQRANQRRK